MLIRKLIINIVAAILGLWIAASFVPGVFVRLLADSSFFGVGLTALWHMYVLLAIIIGLLNFFIKPILNAIALPLRIITLGLFSFVINGALIWAVDAMFHEFSAPFIFPLLWTTLIIWGIAIVLSLFLKEEPH